MKLKRVHFAMWIAAAVFPASLMGQSNSPAAGCDASSLAVSPSAGHFDMEKLENDTSIHAATSDAVNQMAMSYDSAHQQTAVSLISGVEPEVIYNVITEALSAQSQPSGDENQVKNQCTAASTTANANKQTGATSGADGATSMTDLTGIPELLSIAVENGSVTNDINGSTMTLSTSLYGLLTGFHEVEDSSQNYNACGFCVRLGASATFNLANSTSPLTNASRKDVSQWQLKYSFFDKSTRSQRVGRAWDKTLGPATQNLVTKGGSGVKSAAAGFYAKLAKALHNYLQSNDAEIMSCIKTISASLNSTTAATTCSFASSSLPPQTGSNSGLATLILHGLDSDPTFQSELKQASGIPELQSWAQGYQEALSAYKVTLPKFEAEVDNLSKGFNADLTFAQQFPTAASSSASTSTASGQAKQYRLVGMDTTTTSTNTAPDYLVGGLDLSWQPKTSNAGQSNKTPLPSQPSVTFNGKASFYTNPNAALNEKTFRGGQAVTQLQWTLGKSPFVGDPNDKSRVALAASGSYQRLSENKDQTGKRPDIVSGNVKLTIPFPNGISFPLAVTFANSSQQQAKGSYVIGNFGLSFDADKLLALLALKH